MLCHVTEENATMTTPVSMLQYVLANELEADFLTAMQLHKGNYTIAEIADGEFLHFENQVRFRSKAYGINVELTDDDVLTGVANGLVITAFLSRQDDRKQLHFLVHDYPESMKEQFSEEMVRKIVQYMILKTIVALRLDSEEKIRTYITL